MKKLLLMVLLVVVLAPYAVCQYAIPTKPVWGQKPVVAKPVWGQQALSAKPLWKEFKVKNMKLDFEERKNEAHFRNEMRKLKLQKKKIELNRPNVRNKNLKFRKNRLNFRNGVVKVLKKKMLIFLIICVILHILFTVWVYNDLKTRQVDGALWIFIVLLSGFWGAIVYSVVRLGDLMALKHEICKEEILVNKKK